MLNKHTCTNRLPVNSKYKSRYQGGLVYTDFNVYIHVLEFVNILDIMSYGICICIMVTIYYSQTCLM